MNCDDFKRELEFGFERGVIELTAELKSHLDSCPACGEYLEELDTLKNLLDEQTFAVKPGELDDITFENVLVIEPKTEYRGVRKGIFAGFARWAWAPAAAAMIIFALVRFSSYSSNTKSEGSASTDTDNLWSYVLGSLAGDSNQFELAQEELTRNGDIDDALASMTDDELQSLYDKLETLKGSAL